MFAKKKRDCASTQEVHSLSLDTLCLEKQTFLFIICLKTGTTCDHVLSCHEVYPILFIQHQI